MGEFGVFSSIRWDWIRGSMLAALSCIKKWKAQVTPAGWVRRREGTGPLSLTKHSTWLPAARLCLTDRQTNNDT